MEGWSQTFLTDRVKYTDFQQKCRFAQSLEAKKLHLPTTKMILFVESWLSPVVLKFHIYSRRGNFVLILEQWLYFTTFILESHNNHKHWAEPSADSGVTAWLILMSSLLFNEVLDLNTTCRWVSDNLRNLTTPCLHFIDLMISHKVKERYPSTHHGDTQTLKFYTWATNSSSSFFLCD